MKKQLQVLAWIYSVRIYAAIISILLIPHIIKLVGYESYGLVGFYAVLLACLNILDAGIGGVITRQAIVSRTSRGNFTAFVAVYNKVVLCFIGVGLFVALAGSLLAHHYGHAWLKTTLSADEVGFCTALMFCIFAVRYLQGPYRSILLSAERQVALSNINLIYMTLSQPVTVLLLMYYSQEIRFYFIVQLLAAVVNTALTVGYGEYVKRKIIAGLSDSDEQVNRLSLRTLLLFALQLSTLSILWIVVNQSDKLALTRFMPLADYAKYSVAVSVSAVVFIISDPLNQVLLPKLTRSWQERNSGQYTRYFFSAFCFVCISLLPLCAFLFFSGQELLYVWSGNRELARGAGQYLPWLFLGAVFGVLSNFCFLLRYSSGDLKNHTLVYLVFSLIVVPLNVFIASTWQGAGTALFFAGSAGVLFVGWAGYNFHRYFRGGLHLLTLLLLPVALLTLGYFWLLSRLDISTADRGLSFLLLLLTGVTGSALAAAWVLLMRKKLNLTFRIPR